MCCISWQCYSSWLTEILSFVKLTLIYMRFSRIHPQIKYSMSIKSYNTYLRTNNSTSTNLSYWHSHVSAKKICPRMCLKGFEYAHRLRIVYLYNGIPVLEKNGVFLHVYKQKNVHNILSAKTNSRTIFINKHTHNTKQKEVKCKWHDL